MVDNAFPIQQPCFSTELALIQHDPSLAQIAGVFESIQPSDTDLGAKPPKDIKITGLWYGQLTKA